MLKFYRVSVRVQFPAWDEKDGFHFFTIGDTKREAIKLARALANRGGQIHSQQGLAWFSATEITRDEFPTDTRRDDRNGYSYREAR